MADIMSGGLACPVDDGRSRYLTAEEIARIWHRSIGSVYRWASVDCWQRTLDGRRPVMYRVRDVEETFGRIDAPSDAA